MESIDPASVPAFGWLASAMQLILQTTSFLPFLQIQSEYEGLKRFKLDPSKDGDTATNGTKEGATVAKSTTAKLLDELANKKAEKYARFNLSCHQKPRNLCYGTTARAHFTMPPSKASN